MTLRIDNKGRNGAKSALRSAPQSSEIVFVGRIPKWMREFIIRARALLGIEDYKLEVRYTDLKTVNRILRRRGYAPLESGDAAAAVIDTTYLFAMLLFIRPFKKSLRAFEIVLHELLHVYLRSKIFSRLNHEFLDHYLDASDQGAAYDAMLQIEERAAEHLVRLSARLGLFEGVAPGK